MERKIPLIITGVPCDSFQKVNSLITKCRLRLFYLGLNRNGGYMTEEFAKKLLSTLPYVPVVGDYSEEDNDFTTHREKNVANSYGVIPENPNVKWEPHLDDDGIERVYATCDVYLWTGRYDVANQIPGKSHSLELNPKSIKGSWQVVDGDQFGYVYENAEFLGLSVLGDKVEPCFEGSAFYSLISNYSNILNEIVEKIKKDGGSKQMLNNYRLSHDEAYRALFEKLNPNFNEAGNWDYETEIVDVYDDYVLTYKCKDKKFERVFYTKDNDTIELGAETEVKITDVTLDEYAILESIKSNYELDSFEAMDKKIKELSDNLDTANASLAEKDETIQSQVSLLEDKEGNITNFSNQISEKDSKILELTESISTYEVEATAAKEKIDALSAEVEVFRKEKADYELAQKNAKIAEYEELVSEANLAPIREKINDYDLRGLEKELRYFAFEDKPEFFSKRTVPAGDGFAQTKNSGIISILEKYKNMEDK